VIMLFTHHRILHKNSVVLAAHVYFSVARVEYRNAARLWSALY
jgi:hypothetical protein